MGEQRPAEERTMTQTERPEIGATVDANGVKTNYLEAGEGPAVVLVHGSGPGVTAYANWRLVLPALAERFHVVAPDMVGFGFTERPADATYNLQTWSDQVVGLLDSLGIDKASIMGNSFGGAIGLRIASQHPERVDKLVLMGSMGVDFPITEGLDRVWGYEPSFENMRKVLDVFAYDRSLVPDELAEVRYRASMQPGFQESYSSMFPAPRQRWVDELSLSRDELERIAAPVLLVHGAQDRIVPLSDSFLGLVETLPDVRGHVFGRCGHASPLEHTDEFNRLLTTFLETDR
jgi:pimeloyl-ACP methyl ester carboxylesterase